MFASSWFWSTLLLFLLVLTPLSYGWGYRAWGVPYPRFFQRRRAQLVPARGATVTNDRRAWGWSADILWVTAFVCIFWNGSLSGHR